MGLTQKQLGDVAKVSGATVSTYENGGVVSDLVKESIQRSITSIKDQLYPQNTYERACYMLKLYVSLFLESETTNDKFRFLNKIVRTVTYIMEHVFDEQKKNKRW